jgi:hypothetical protein
MKVGDLVRHNHYGYTGVIIAPRDCLNKWRVVTRGLVRLWFNDDIEVIHESR